MRIMDPAEPISSCARCGQPHIRNGKPTCTGHVKADQPPGRPCRNHPRHGQRVCDSHGGNAKQNVNAARRRLVEQQAARVIRGQPVIPVSNPLQQLADLVGEALAFKDALAIMVNEKRSLLTGYTDEETGIFVERLKAEVMAYERALDRAGRFLEGMARLDLDERLARFEALKTEARVEFVNALYDHIRTSPDLHTVLETWPQLVRLAAEQVSRELRALAA